MSVETPTRLSEDIRQAFLESEEAVTVGDILDRVEHKSFGLLLVLLSLPSAVPMPAPGYSTPFGIVLATLAVQMLMLRPHPWLPERVLKRKVKTKGKTSLLAAMLRLVGFFEGFLKPRWGWLYARPSYRMLTSVVVFLCAVSMILPIPLTNSTPAFGIFLMGLGLIEEDSLFGVAGLAVGVVGLLVTTAVLWAIGVYGPEGIDLVQEWIRGRLGS